MTVNYSNGRTSASSVEFGQQQIGQRYPLRLPQPALPPRRLPLPPRRLPLPDVLLGGSGLAHVGPGLGGGVLEVAAVEFAGEDHLAVGEDGLETVAVAVHDALEGVAQGEHRFAVAQLAHARLLAVPGQPGLLLAPLLLRLLHPLSALPDAGFAGVLRGLNHRWGVFGDCELRWFGGLRVPGLLQLLVQRFELLLALVPLLPLRNGVVDGGLHPLLLPHQLLQPVLSLPQPLLPPQQLLTGLLDHPLQLPLPGRPLLTLLVDLSVELVDGGVGLADLGDAGALLLLVVAEGGFDLLEVVPVLVLLAEVFDHGDAVVVEGEVDLLANSRNLLLILLDLPARLLHPLPHPLQIRLKEAVQLLLRLAAALPNNGLHLGQLQQILLDLAAAGLVVDQPLPDKLRELLRQPPAAEVQVDARLRLLAPHPVAARVLLEEETVEFAQLPQGVGLAEIVAFGLELHEFDADEFETVFEFVLVEREAALLLPLLQFGLSLLQAGLELEDFGLEGRVFGLQLQDAHNQLIFSLILMAVSLQQFLVVLLLRHPLLRIQRHRLPVLPQHHQLVPHPLPLLPLRPHRLLPLPHRPLRQRVLLQLPRVAALGTRHCLGALELGDLALEDEQAVVSLREGQILSMDCVGVPQRLLAHRALSVETDGVLDGHGEVAQGKRRVGPLHANDPRSQGLQLPQQPPRQRPRLRMPREHPQRQPVVLARLLQLVRLQVPQRQVVRRLEVRRLPVALLRVVDRRLHPSLPRLHHRHVPQGLRVVRLQAQRHPEGHPRHLQLPELRVDVADVVPDVGVEVGVVLGEEEGALEAGVVEVVLVVAEAAERHVVPDLDGLAPQLHQSLVHLERDLRLVLVEVVGRDVRHRLRVAVLHRQRPLVVLVRLLRLLQLVVHPPQRDVQPRLVGVHLLRLAEGGQTALHVVLLLADAAEVEVGLDVVVVLHRGQQLLLALLQEPQLVVALPQRELPPGVLVVVGLGRVARQLQAFADVVLHVEEVLEDQARLGTAGCDFAEVCLVAVEEVLPVLLERGCGESQDAAV